MKRKRLTKEVALTACRDLWLWLAKNPTKSKEDWPGWEKYTDYVSLEKAKFFDEYGHELMTADCPCCEYKLQRLGYYDVDHIRACYRFCPLIVHWSSTCLAVGTDFDKWGKVKPRKNLAKAKREIRTENAMSIANAADKELQKILRRKRYAKKK